MRFLLTLALLSLGPAVAAQTSFRLVDPLLSIDGDRVPTMGAPLVQEPFGVLTISVPGAGTYTVSERPFAGATRAGQFDGAGLYFAVAGQSVRLLSRTPLLSLSGPTSAYVLYRPGASRAAQGPARLTIADDLAGRGRRSTTERPVTRPTPATSGPRPTLADRPAARYVRDAEVSRLRSELDRLVADRHRLATERDRLAAERDAAVRAQSIASASSQNADAMARSLARITAERDRLATERDRLMAERAQLASALARAQSERDALAAEFGTLRERAEVAEAGWSRTRGTASPLQADVAQLRAAIQQRDRTIDLLRAEQADRSSRIPSVDADLADLRRQLEATAAERDRAIRDRDRAYGLRDDAVAALDRSVQDTDALRRERDRLIAERDRVRVAPQAPPASDVLVREQEALNAERAALTRDRQLLDADRAALAADRAAFESMRGAGVSQSPGPDFADRAALLERLDIAQAEREALMAERNRLSAELRALRAQPRPADAPRPEPQTIRTPTVPSDGAVAFLPGFDFGRLGNPDVIRRRLDEAEYPRWATVGRIEGDVLVLFQTDSSGRVVTTAVPTPLGGGLDGLAEEIVREMRFVPPVVDGQPTGLRSQVVVRFEL